MDPVKKFTFLLFIIATLFVVVSGILYIFNTLTNWSNPYLVGVFPYLDMATEYNIPSFYAASLWLCLSFYALVIGFLAPKLKFSWYALSLIAFFAGADEATLLHEQLYLISGYFAPYLPTSILSYSWVYGGIFLVIVVSLLFLPLALKLPRRTLGLLALAAFTFILGAVVMETIGGHIESYFGIVTWQLMLAIHIEEWLEYLGVILAIFALNQLVSVIQGEGVRLIFNGYKGQEITFNPSEINYLP